MFFKERAAASKRYQCVTASERKRAPIFLGAIAIALSYPPPPPPPRVRVRATVKLSAALFHDESSITIGGVRKCNSAFFCVVAASRNISMFFNERAAASERYQ